MKLQIVRFFNGYGLQEFAMRIKYHKCKSESGKTAMLISTIDTRRKTQGLADRLKGIVSIYALSKATNTPFRCLFTHPFQLNDFLKPNKVNWLPTNEELSNSISGVRYKILRKQPKMNRLLKLLPLKHQVRVYANLDYLDEINALYKQSYRWDELFHELFKPSAQLSEQIEQHKNTIGTNFIACAFRFQSLLGDFNEYNQPALTDDEQNELIWANIKALEAVIEKEKMPALITSDSKRFLKIAKKLDNVFTLRGKIIHLDCNSEEADDTYLKVFVDFFMISEAQKVFSIGTKRMYPSEYPLYASKINNKPFERILAE